MEIPGLAGAENPNAAPEPHFPLRAVGKVDGWG